MSHVAEQGVSAKQGIRGNFLGTPWRMMGTALWPSSYLQLHQCTAAAPDTLRPCLSAAQQQRQEVHLYKQRWHLSTSLQPPATAVPPLPCM